MKKTNIICILIISMFLTTSLTTANSLYTKDETSVNKEIITEEIKITPPESIFSLNFKTAGNLELGKDISIILEATSLQNIPNAHIDITIPSSIILIDGNTQWNGKITEDSTIKIPLKIILNEEKDYTIYATINDEDGFFKEKHAEYYFSVLNGVVKAGNNLMSFMNIDEKTGDICAQATKIEEKDYLSTNTDSDPLTASRDGLTLRTCWWYYNDDNIQRIVHVPIMFVIVDLFKTSSIDDDEPIEEYVGSSYTDGAGFVEFNNLEPGQYYKVRLYSETSSNSGYDAAWVTGPGQVDTDHRFTLSSDWIELNEDKEILYQTEETCGKAFFLLNYVVWAYHWLEEETGWARSKIGIEWPGDGTYFVPYWDYISVDGLNTLIDGPHGILHEYSHAIMYSAYGNDFPDYDDIYDPHYRAMETDPGFALIEGWAEFLPYVFELPNSIGDHFLYEYLIMETAYFADHVDDGWEDVVPGVSGDGVIVEGAVGSALLDLVDGESTTDYPSWSDIEIGDYVSDEFSKLWTIILNDNPDNIMEIWDCWNTRFGTNTDIWAIFYHQRMDFPHTFEEYTLTANIEGQGTVTIDPEQDTYTHGTYVTLTANPETGWYFDHWDGDLTGDTSPENVRMDKNKIITAFFTEEEQSPPNTPNTPNGPESGRTGVSYQYTASTTDPDDDLVQYKFDWGDGTESSWTYLVSSGFPGSKQKSWEEEGIYQIRAKARDEHEAESGWSNPLEVIITSEESYLNCIGDIIFSEEVEPGSVIYGSFYIENIGEPDSNLNWEVIEKPYYADVFPSSGYNLKPSQGQFEVDVDITVPDRENGDYSSEIIVRNMDDPSNEDTVMIMFSTAVSSPGIIEGNVYDNDGDPISNSHVVLYESGDTSGISEGGEYDTYTDSDGYYSIMPEANTYNMRVTATGYKSETVSSITINDGDMETIDFYLDESASLYGYVYDNAGNPIGGAKVELDTGEYTTTLPYGNLEGYYYFTNQELSPGTYDITASKTGYTSETVYDYVLNQGPNELDFTLQGNVELPTVTTTGASTIGSNGATINGELNSLGGDNSCTVWFQYGTTTAYGQTTNTITKTTTGDYSDNIGGLQSSTTYHYRAVANNDAGTNYGDDRTFTTLSDITLPNIENLQTSNIQEKQVTLTATLTNDGGEPCTLEFYIKQGTTTVASWTKTGTYNSPHTYSHTFYGLTSGTNYYAYAKASNSAGGKTILTTFTTDNQDPVAVITGPDTIPRTEDATYDGYDSYDDGTIVQYDWYGRKSGDIIAQWHNDIGPEFTVRYATTGQKTIKLRVWDDNGASTTTEKTITVEWS